MLEVLLMGSKFYLRVFGSTYNKNWNTPNRVTWIFSLADDLFQRKKVQRDYGKEKVYLTRTVWDEGDGFCETIMLLSFLNNSHFTS